MVFAVLGVAAVASVAATFTLFGPLAVARRHKGAQPRQFPVQRTEAAQAARATPATPIRSALPSAHHPPTGTSNTDARVYFDYISGEIRYHSDKLRYAEQTRRQGAVTAAQRAMLEERLRNAGKVVELFKLVGDQSTSGLLRPIVLVRRVQPWYDKRARELVAQQTGLGPSRRLPVWQRIVNRITGGARKGDCDTLCRQHEMELGWYEQQRPTARYYLDNHLDAEARDAMRSALIHHLHHAYGPSEPLVWY